MHHLNVSSTIRSREQDRINELVLKLQAAEAAAQKNSNVARVNDSSGTEHSLLLKAREDDLEKYRGLVAEAEKNVSNSGCLLILNIQDVANAESRKPQG